MFQVCIFPRGSLSGPMLNKLYKTISGADDCWGEEIVEPLYPFDYTQFELFFCFRRRWRRRPPTLSCRSQDTHSRTATATSGRLTVSTLRSKSIIHRTLNFTSRRPANALCLGLINHFIVFNYMDNLLVLELSFSINNVTVSSVLYCIIFNNTANLCLNGNVSIENVFVSIPWFPNNNLYCCFFSKSLT